MAIESSQFCCNKEISFTRLNYEHRFHIQVVYWTLYVQEWVERPLTSSVVRFFPLAPRGKWHLEKREYFLTYKRKQSTMLSHQGTHVGLNIGGWLCGWYRNHVLKWYSQTHNVTIYFIGSVGFVICPICGTLLNVMYRNFKNVIHRDTVIFIICLLQLH